MAYLHSFSRHVRCCGSYTNKFRSFGVIYRFKKSNLTVMIHLTKSFWKVSNEQGLDIKGLND